MLTSSNNSTCLGENLIFLISQPRSGSTLLQHIIASHPEVHTTAEPWFLLPLIYALKPMGVEAEYNAEYARLAFEGFLESLPGGKAIYEEQTRKMVLSLYERVLEGKGKIYFLDKTPRYYLIIPDLVQLFPQAKFILLIRNPLAVLLSILNYNFQCDWKGFAKPDRVLDVCMAPKLMIQGMQTLRGRAAVVHYESLIQNPQKEVKNICEQIGLEFYPEMLEYGGKVRLSGSFVDNKSVYNHSKPVCDYVEQWRTGFDNLQSKRFAIGYLESLGPELVNQLGYSFDELVHGIHAQPTIKKGLFTISWRQLIERPNRLRWWERLGATALLPHKRMSLKARIMLYGQAIFGYR